MKIADCDDVGVTISHSWGDVEVSLECWIKFGPGPRWLTHPISMRCGETGRKIPLSELPLKYRNNVLSRFLIRRGYLENPWIIESLDFIVTHHDEADKGYWIARCDHIREEIEGETLEDLMAKVHDLAETHIKQVFEDQDPRSPYGMVENPCVRLIYEVR